MRTLLDVLVIVLSIAIAWRMESRVQRFRRPGHSKWPYSPLPHEELYDESGQRARRAAYRTNVVIFVLVGAYLVMRGLGIL